MFYTFFAFIISASVYTILYFKLNRGWIFFSKILTILFLFAFAIMSYYKTELTYGFYIVLGLSIGIVGDIFLGLQRINPKNKVIYQFLGILSFLFGHLFYSYAFQTYSQLPIYIYSTVPLFLAIVVILFLHLYNLNFGKSKYITYTYILIASFLLIFAFGSFRNGFGLFQLAVAIGALAFIISDFILCFIYFNIEKKYHFLKYINIISYYIGQGLIVLSILLI